jgi:hypothetical protein
LGYQWFFNGSSIQNATNATLVLSNVRATNAGSYYCIVSNASGSATSSSAALTVRVPPSIVTHPAPQTVNPGESVTFTVSVSGTAPFTYQWRLNNTAMPGQTNATLVFNSAGHTNGGNYNVSVANPAGTALSQFAELIVRPQLASIRPMGSAPYAQLTLNGTPGRSYVLEGSTNLTSWTAVTNLTISTLPQQQIDDGWDLRVHPSRHYRLRLAP